MTYTAASVANSFLNRSFSEPDAPKISPMKIQKLIYLAHGYYLVETGKPMLDELFEAWKFGPVLPSLYHSCKHLGSSNLERFLVDNVVGTKSKNSAPLVTDIRANDIIDFVWKEYGAEAAIKLSAWTHVRGGPWDKVTDGGRNIIRNQDIPNDYIAEYFRENLYDEESAEEATA